MSRRRSLVGVVPHATCRFLVFLCVAAIAVPALTHAKRGKRAAEAAQDGDDLGTSGHEGTDSGALFAEQPSRRPDQVIDPGQLPERDVPPPAYEPDNEWDEHVHVQRGDTLEHILLM